MSMGMRKTSIQIVMATMLLCVYGSASGQIYKCVGKDGKKSFQATPCPESEAESTVAIEGPTWKIGYENGTNVSASVLYVDVGHIVVEGELKRVRARLQVEYGRKRKVSDITNMKVLYDCNNRKLAVVSRENEKYRRQYKAEDTPEGLQWRSFNAIDPLSARGVLMLVCGG